MSAPFLWLIVGPNGAGKSTYQQRVIAPHLKLPFVNADLIARARWGDAHTRHAYDAARMAEATRQRLIGVRASFVAETVFSHPAKLALVDQARDAGYIVWMSYINVALPALSVARVGARVREGGHPVASDKVRSRYAKLQANVQASVARVDRLMVVDNTASDRALRDIMLFESGRLVWAAAGPPAWAAALFASYLEA